MVPIPYITFSDFKQAFAYILQHLEEFSPISDDQWGFIKGKSTTGALVTATDHWQRYLESGHDVCAVFLDFKKAFDSVMHEVLMNKLSALRLSPFLLKWIANYLTNRSQFVGTSSGTTPVVSGVPLGSILGPLLFLIYVNDITEIQLSGSHLLLYADDVLLYRSIQSQADYLLLQADIYIY